MMKQIANEGSIPEELVCFSNALAGFIHQIPDTSHVTIAYSGGLDSTVLLHLFSFSPHLKGRLTARYINHGLQDAAADWQAHCEKMCASLGVPFKSSKIQLLSVKREGMEAVARKLRYQALTVDCCITTDVLVTGHHQRDQAETVVLNLARGSGVMGLSAMPYCKELRTESGQVMHLRPLLAIPYQKLQDYAAYFDLNWVEDPSNALTRYRRNAVRQKILPVLNVYWPEVEKTLARTAEHMSESLTLLDRMAKMQLALIQNLAFYFDFSQLELLDWLEQKNCLRYWFFNQFNIVLSTKHYEWIREVLGKKVTSRQNAFSYQLRHGVLRFYKQRLYYQIKTLSPFCFQDVLYHQDKTSLTGESLVLRLEGGEIFLSQAPLLAQYSYYTWELEQAFTHRLSELVVRNITKDDIENKINRKKLKAFFQQNSIPVWERMFWPVLECDGMVVSVLGCNNCVKRTVE